MVEGDLWRYCQTDLTDFYAGALTLRQVWVRFQSLPYEAAIREVLRERAEAAETVERADEIESLLSAFKPTREE